MKQHVTVEQIKELNHDQFEALGDILGPISNYDDYSELLTIGKMIEILGDNWQMKLFCSPMHDCGIYNNLNYWKSKELADALFMVVKEVLQ